MRKKTISLILILFLIQNINSQTMIWGYNIGGHIEDLPLDLEKLRMESYYLQLLIIILKDFVNMVIMEIYFGSLTYLKIYQKAKALSTSS